VAWRGPFVIRRGRGDNSESDRPRGLPTKDYLDAVIKDRPIYLRAYDGHSGWANSKALQLAGITRNTKFDGYGEIVRGYSGEPTGALKEGAQRLVSRLIPEPTLERKLDALRQGMKLAASLGITSIQNAGGAPEEFSLYEELLKRGELTIRVSMAFSTGARTTRQETDRFVALKKQYDLNPILRANSVKLVFDTGLRQRLARGDQP
jgi:predicted amidohydrolase YtcJ